MRGDEGEVAVHGHAVADHAISRPALAGVRRGVDAGAHQVWSGAQPLHQVDRVVAAAQQGVLAPDRVDGTGDGVPYAGVEEPGLVGRGAGEAPNDLEVTLSGTEQGHRA